LKDHFRPEFLNRLDEIVFFNLLTKEIVREIIVKELELFIRRVYQEKSIKLKYKEEIVEKIFHQVYSEEYGARPIKHYVEREVGTLVAQQIISRFLRPGGNFLLDIEKDTNEIKITVLSLLEQKKNFLK
jgi:ATP-dependent Clp protease ATP-binding subunit ClpB